MPELVAYLDLHTMVTVRMKKLWVSVSVLVVGSGCCPLRLVAVAYERRRRAVLHVTDSYIDERRADRSRPVSGCISSWFVQVVFLLSVLVFSVRYALGNIGFIPRYWYEMQELLFFDAVCAEHSLLRVPTMWRRRYLQPHDCHDTPFRLSYASLQAYCYDSHHCDASCYKYRHCVAYDAPQVRSIKCVMRWSTKA